MNGLPSLNSVKDWLAWAFWLLLGGGAVKAHSMYVASRKLPAEIHRTEAEGNRISAEVVKVKAEAGKVKAESEVSVAQTALQMAREVNERCERQAARIEELERRNDEMVREARVRDDKLHESERDCMRCQEELKGVKERLKQFEDLL